MKMHPKVVCSAGRLFVQQLYTVLQSRQTFPTRCTRRRRRGVLCLLGVIAVVAGPTLLDVHTCIDGAQPLVAGVVGVVGHTRFPFSCSGGAQALVAVI